MLNASEELPMEAELNEDFKDLLKLFTSNNVRYLLIGGYAVIVHGHPRLTNDLDPVIDAELLPRAFDTKFLK